MTSLTTGEEGVPLLRVHGGHADVPRDKYLVAYGIFVAQGIGLMLPWNAFISAADYFTYLYGNTFLFFISLAFNYSGVLTFATLMKLLPRFTFTTRVMTSLSIFFVVLIIIPLLDSTPTKVSISITLVGVFVTGFAAVVIQSTITGLAALFPPEYVGGTMSGCGVAGIIAILLRVITKVSFSQSPSGFQASGRLFFFLGAGFVAVCAVAFLFLMRLPVTQYHLTNYYKLNTSGNAHAAHEASFTVIIRKIWREGFSIFATFFVTLSLFPGITSLVQSNNDNLSPDWFSILFTGLFMLGDWVGRTAPRWFHIFSPRVLPIPTLARLVFFPLLMFCIKPHIISSDVVSCIIMLLFALSNGYISTLGMIYGPQKVAPHEKELAGIILVGCLITGIIVGSHFALLMLYFLTGNIGVTL